MFVPGAIAATGHPSMMMAPADAARAPVGPTQQITGTFDPAMACTMPRIEDDRPPGVSILIKTEEACSVFAVLMPRSTYRALSGSTVPVNETTIMGFVKLAEARAVNKKTS